MISPLTVGSNSVDLTPKTRASVEVTGFPTKPPEISAPVIMDIIESVLNKIREEEKEIFTEIEKTVKHQREIIEDVVGAKINQAFNFDDPVVGPANISALTTIDLPVVVSKPIGVDYIVDSPASAEPLKNLRVSRNTKTGIVRTVFDDPELTDLDLKAETSDQYFARKKNAQNLVDLNIMTAEVFDAKFGDNAEAARLQEIENAPFRQSKTIKIENPDIDLTQIVDSDVPEIFLPPDSNNAKERSLDDFGKEKSDTEIYRALGDGPPEIDPTYHAIGARKRLEAATIPEFAPSQMVHPEMDAETKEDLEQNGVGENSQTRRLKSLSDFSPLSTPEVAASQENTMREESFSDLGEKQGEAGRVENQNQSLVPFANVQEEKAVELSVATPAAVEDVPFVPVIENKRRATNTRTGVSVVVYDDVELSPLDEERESTNQFLERKENAKKLVTVGLMTAESFDHKFGLKEQALAEGQRLSARDSFGLSGRDELKSVIDSSYMTPSNIVDTEKRLRPFVNAPGFGTVFHTDDTNPLVSGVRASNSGDIYKVVSLRAWGGGDNPSVIVPVPGGGTLWPTWDYVRFPNI